MKRGTVFHSSALWTISKASESKVCAAEGANQYRLHISSTSVQKQSSPKILSPRWAPVTYKLHVVKITKWNI